MAEEMRSDVGLLVCCGNNRCVKLLGGERSLINALSKAHLRRREGERVRNHCDNPTEIEALKVADDKVIID